MLVPTSVSALQSKNPILKPVLFLTRKEWDSEPKNGFRGMKPLRWSKLELDTAEKNGGYIGEKYGTRFYIKKRDKHGR